jgi:hypothetical protein
MVAGAGQSQEVFEYLDRLRDAGVLSWWPLALRAAADANARRWSYVRAILEGCLRENRPPGARAPGAGATGAARPPASGRGRTFGLRRAADDPGCVAMTPEEIEEWDRAGAALAAR